MEKFLKNEVKYQWNDECQKILDTLKKNMVTTPTLVFPDWSKEFHVHVDASLITLGEFLAQPGEGDIHHTISFANRKLSSIERNYTTT
jgi:hypothetical protein